MEAYKNDAREILHRFLDYTLSLPNCIASLDAALAALIPRLHPEELPVLRAMLIANSETVIKEMERRAAGVGLDHAPFRTKRKRRGAKSKPLPVAPRSN